MLRTFDELRYRQEQRFHLELGLLKLVHLQRLLPVEELLSQLPAPGRENRIEWRPIAAANRSSPNPARPRPARGEPRHRRSHLLRQTETARSRARLLAPVTDAVSMTAGPAATQSVAPRA